MYLKSVSIKNYRKFLAKQTFYFAHSKWSKGIDKMTDTEKERETEKYISKSMSLLVGKNNAGKSTVIQLINTLQNTKCGNRNVFKYTDFNLNYLHRWYDDHILNTSEELNNISSEDLPFMEFEIELGIDDENDIISDFEDVLVIGGINNSLEYDEVAKVPIKIRYEVADRTKFLDKLSEICNQETKNSIDEQEINEDSSLQKQNREEIQYRKFLNLFSENYYVLNFYPLDSTEPAEQFSLASLLKVDVVEANTIKDNDTLSKAYSKIVSTYAKNNNLDSINKVVDNLNLQIKNMVDENIKGILQNAVSAVESTKNLRMNLFPDVTLEKIFANNIIYEYQENNDNIPEEQYGMGYTNLMVIIANIVDYIELYREDDINGSINVLCIEEPESFMHPQMQELFIRNIARAIARLLGEKDEFDTFQVLITTHSSHILNSKIQSGNSLSNIIYLGSPSGQNIVKSIKDSDLVQEEKNSEIGKYEYIKKYLRLEATDLFFADAIVLVEGISEETYIRYLIDQKKELSNYHIEVYRIDGAYAHKLVDLLKLLGIKTVILTDLDLKRTNDEKNIKNLNEVCKNNNGCLSTNVALKKLIGERFFEDKAFSSISPQDISEAIINTINEKEYLEFNIPNTNIFIYSQGKINGSYATSFEEAIVLTNGKDNRQSLEKLLGEIYPRKYSKKELRDKDFLENSFKYQHGIAIGRGKERFSTSIVYHSINEDDFKIKVPQYISLALEKLR